MLLWYCDMSCMLLNAKIYLIIICVSSHAMTVCFLVLNLISNKKLIHRAIIFFCFTEATSPVFDLKVTYLFSLGLIINSTKNYEKQLNIFCIFTISIPFFYFWLYFPIWKFWNYFTSLIHLKFISNSSALLISHHFSLQLLPLFFSLILFLDLFFYSFQKWQNISFPHIILA